MFVSIVATLALSPQRMHHHHGHAKTAVVVDEDKAIRATGARVQNALQTKNFGAFRSMLTSDCKQELPNHQILNVRQMVSMMRQFIEPVSDLKVSIDIQQVKVDGRTATVDDRFLLSGKVQDKKGKHNLRAEGSETVSLKKVGSKWLAYYDKVHDQSSAIDGHVVMHMP